MESGERLTTSALGRIESASVFIMRLESSAPTSQFAMTDQRKTIDGVITERRSVIRKKDFTNKSEQVGFRGAGVDMKKSIERTC
uniref:Uncharacterized protein n=1 Tax=Heterorhabditis bacteriophora TaxID=37862 RepID=A0A1I7WRX2_HETBA